MLGNESGFYNCWSLIGFYVVDLNVSSWLIASKSGYINFERSRVYCFLLSSF